MRAKRKQSTQDIRVLEIYFDEYIMHNHNFNIKDKISIKV